MADHNPHRLPRTVLPQRYDLTIAPDLAAASFEGTVDIEVNVAEASSEVVLNAIELQLHEAWVTAGPDRLAAAVTLDEATERAVLTLPRAIEPGAAVVSLRFTGILNDKLHGFYRSHFTDASGAERFIATTQFEATDARRAFPCWDEPDFKATFAITLEVDEALTAVSNAAVVSDEPAGEGKRRVRFAETMPLSTYLVAYVVGPLEATEARDVDGTPTRLVYPPGKGHLTALGLDVADRSLRYLADYFDLPYPGDSLDLVAIPDFAFGAMENLGCVTFRETLLLADPAHATQGELQNIVDVIAHELAHMWFGDLVTMTWWNGIWLNEAFATFMELKATDVLHPEWERWVSFGLARTTAFDTDALESTRPIEYDVVSPAEAQGMFDVLTYEKGAAVVRMLEQYLGEDRFRDGIRRYMADNQYGNTETTDLWDALEAASGEPVRRIMDSWIFQGGHPLVTVSTTDRGSLRIEQERVSYIPDGDRSARWSVPLQLRIGHEDGSTTTRIELLEGDEIEIPLDSPAVWVVANAESHGFYRVRYTPELRTALAQRAQSVLSDVERYGLVDDTWASVLAAALPASDFLDLAELFTDETDPSVWRRLLGGLDQIDRLLDGPARAGLQRHVRAIVQPALERLGWEPAEGDSDRDRELRGALIGALAVLGNDPDAQARVRALFARVRADGDSVEANVAAAVVRATAALAGRDDLEQLIEGFRTGSTPQEEQRYLYALADVRHAGQMEQVLELAMTPAVRTQNAPFLIGACVANRDHGPLAWKLVKDRWDEMNDRFPSNSIVRMLHGIRPVTDPALADDIEDFLTQHPVPQGQQTLRQHLERMRVSVALREREAQRLTARLA
ncbi:MAG TPA: M1 family metallopeptidase [Acidimicrobiales bacterium]|nr:M1 family metallopeptidase [Acidimicrobiales bacterium]